MNEWGGKIFYSHVSGLEVNSSKTEGMWIGSLKSNEEKPFGIKWPSEPIKALGVFFTSIKHYFTKKTSGINLIK